MYLEHKGKAYAAIQNVPSYFTLTWLFKVKSLKMAILAQLLDKKYAYLV